MNFGFIIDNRKCIGCHACTVACKAEHEVPVGVNRTWVKYIEKGTFPDTRRLFSVMRCNHCADAPCVEICPVTALYTRADGIVDFDSPPLYRLQSLHASLPVRRALYGAGGTHGGEMQLLHAPRRHRFRTRLRQRLSRTRHYFGRYGQSCERDLAASGARSRVCEKTRKRNKTEAFLYRRRQRFARLRPKQIRKRIICGRANRRASGIMPNLPKSEE